MASSDDKSPNCILWFDETMLPQRRQDLPYGSPSFGVDRPATRRSADGGAPRSHNLLAADQNRTRAQLADFPVSAAIECEHRVASDEYPQPVPAE